MPSLQPHFISRNLHTLLGGIAISPLFLNDVFFIFTETATEWLVVDYVSKIMSLAVVFFVPSLRSLVPSYFQPLGNQHEASLMTFLRLGALTWLSTFVIILFDLILYEQIAKWLPGSRNFVPPSIQSDVIRVIDTALGLAFTAISEELICRGMVRSLLERYTASRILVVVLSSVIFASIHWSRAAPTIVFAFFAGIVLMALYLRTRSLLPSMLVHYIIDAWYLA